MQKRRGPKSRGHNKHSDYHRGYQTGWRRVENRAKGIKPRQSGKGKIQISAQNKDYQRGFEAGTKSARRFYKKR